MWNKIIYFRELCHYLIVTEGNGALVQRKPSQKKSGLISVTITFHPLRSFVICNPECIVKGGCPENPEISWWIPDGLVPA